MSDVSLHPSSAFNYRFVMFAKLNIKMHCFHRARHPPAAPASLLHGLFRQAGLQQGGAAAGELQPQPAAGAARLPHPVQEHLPR